MAAMYELVLMCADIYWYALMCTHVYENWRVLACAHVYRIVLSARPDDGTEKY